MTTAESNIETLEQQYESVNTDLGEIEEQLLQMEDTSNKVTQITGNEGVAKYPTALAVKAYVDAAIAAALNNG